MPSSVPPVSDPYLKELLYDRALVPTVHMANTVGKRSSSKYQEGQEVTGRILEVDSAKKRVSMTLKKLLCSDKLPAITTFQVSFCSTVA